MNKLEEIINTIAFKRMQQNIKVSFVYVNNNTYNLINELCQTTEIDYDNINIKACDSVSLVIDNTLKDGEVEYK